MKINENIAFALRSFRRLAIGKYAFCNIAEGTHAGSVTMKASERLFAIAPDMETLASLDPETIGETIKPIRYGNGEFLFTASIQVSNPFFGWIASFGGRVRIHSPEEVKGQYKEFIKDLEKSLEKR